MYFINKTRYHHLQHYMPTPFLTIKNITIYNLTTYLQYSKSQIGSVQFRSDTMTKAAGRQAERYNQLNSAPHS